jgi:AsmA protein
MKRYILRFLKITGIAIASILALLFLIPILFPGTVVEKTKAWANRSINGELNFSKVRLSFFNHFPSLTVTLYDVLLKGSAPFKKDTLVSSAEIALGINLKSLVFNKRIDIDKIFLTDAFLHVKINEKGEANYNVYISKNNQSVKTDSSSASMRLEKINVDNTHFVYDDQSIPMYIDAKGFNYSGNGDLSKDIFDLYSHAKIDSIDFYYDKEPYLINKKVDADLVTRINTSSLAFIFQKNNLLINRLPVQFNGRLDFLKNGYDIDLGLKSSNSELHDLITALPPQYITWLEKTKVTGSTDILFTLKGQYNASQNKAPDLALDLKIRDGYVKYENAPFPASNLFLNFKTKMPSLNTDSLQVTIDSLFFNVDKDYLSGIINMAGINKPLIEAKIRAEMDLAKANKAFGLQGINFGGLLKINVLSKGQYDPAKKTFPVTNAEVSWQNGSVQTKYYPHPINDIQLSAKIKDDKGTLNDLYISVQPFSFLFEGNPFHVQATLNDFENIVYSIKAKGEIDVAKVYKVFSQKGLDLKGFIKTDVDLQGSQEDASKGRYAKLHNSGTLELRDIKTTSEFFPHPFIIKKGLFKFNQDKLLFNDFTGAYAHSDFKMNGYLQNVIDYALSTSAVLKGNFALNSTFINADEFIMPSSSAAKKKSGTGVIIVPPNYNLGLTASAGKVVFNGLEMDSVRGKIGVNKGVLSLTETGFNLIGCNVVMNATYGSTSASKAFFDYGINAKDFDIARAYKEIKLFHDLATAAANAQGIISLDYKLKGILEGSMHPVYPSLEGGGTLSVKDVKVKGLKLFAAVSKSTSRDSINNPNLRKVDIKTTIKNNIITIERFKFRVAGFRPRIEGQTSFDGQLNLKMRLGLPPFGIIGIPLHISGTQDNPTVRLGRGKNDEIKEKTYK